MSNITLDIETLPDMRPGAREAIALLHRLGLKTVMATGDLEAVARHVAREVGIDEVVARATPADKLAVIRRLQACGPNAHRGFRRVPRLGPCGRSCCPRPS